MRFKDLAERQILKAKAEGQLTGLKGEGKPLPYSGYGDAAETAGFRIMAEAGALPREFTLKDERDAQAKLLAGLTDPEDRKAAMAKLADIEMRLAIEQDARRKFLKP
jgi:hypothetical protein